MSQIKHCPWPNLTFGTFESVWGVILQVGTGGRKEGPLPKMQLQNLKSYIFWEITHFFNLTQTMVNQSQVIQSSPNHHSTPPSVSQSPGSPGSPALSWGASFAAWLNEEAHNVPLEELLKPLPSEVIQQVGDGQRQLFPWKLVKPTGKNVHGEEVNYCNWLFHVYGMRYILCTWRFC